MSRWAALLIVTAGLVLIQIVPRDGPPSIASAQADPILATAGDIACDPNDANFRDGNGTASD